MTLGWYWYMTLLSVDELSFLWPYILLTSGNLSSMSRLGQSFDLRDWIWMLQVFRQQRQRPSNGRGLEEKKKTCHETFGLLQVGQYPLILLESKCSVSHCHSVLVADALSQMPFKPHQSVVFPEQNCFYLFLLLSGSVGNRPCLCIPSCMQFAPVVSQVHL